MSDIAIRANGLGKRYRIGAKQQAFNRLSEQVMHTLTAPARRLRRLGQPQTEEETIWALKDVSFEIERGEVMGVIGRNGAGKSTLLKILSRITEPTEGTAEIHGRVGSLLEVGTGFHPELTGRENIYLNGTILGMKKAEVDAKFDEIVAFAEVEPFLDTPVKRYSSGMTVRLAFSVAAHLEPEILLVDEVLAVGDAAFQKKCLGKMGEVTSEGRTVLFVSHNMGAIESLCKRCMLIKTGRVDILSEDVGAVTNAYLASTVWTPGENGQQHTLATDRFVLHRFGLHQGRDGAPSSAFRRTDEIVLEMQIDVLVRDPALEIGYALYERVSNACLWRSQVGDVEDRVLEPGPTVLRTALPVGLLNNGQYRVELLAAIRNLRWLAEPGQSPVSAEFTIEGGALGSAQAASSQRHALLSPILDWEIERQ